MTVDELINSGMLSVMTVSEARRARGDDAWSMHVSARKFRRDALAGLFESITTCTRDKIGAPVTDRLSEVAQDFLLSVMFGHQQIDQAFQRLADGKTNFGFIHRPVSIPSKPETIRESHRARMLSEMRELFERTEAAIAADEAEAERGRVQHILSLDPARRS